MAAAVLDAIKAKFGPGILATSSHHGDDVAIVKREALREIASFLRDDPAMAFKLPCYCTCIDYLGLEGLAPSAGTVPTGYASRTRGEGSGAPGARFAMVYELRSLTHGHRIRLKVPLMEEDLVVPSLADLWPAFNWLERETYDMYGVSFQGHPDLRRIFMYEEFVGYPLRKDYPKEKRQPLVRREWSDE
ncbi:MAG TPA: NADH-quinone oxidoreductase subunit C [Kofleriaceae bacterium]|nr:NADH-quinone oxidoreductase subunit C [Kofleriaceae bacterium]